MSKRLGTTRPGAERRAVGERAMTTTTARTPRHSTKLLLAVVVGGLALLAAGVGPATAAPAASLQATSTCWQQVINDWLPDNKVDRTYPIPCYTQAIQHLSQYPDVATSTRPLGAARAATARRPTLGNSSAASWSPGTNTT